MQRNIPVHHSAASRPTQDGILLRAAPARALSRRAVCAASRRRLRTEACPSASATRTFVALWPYRIMPRLAGTVHVHTGDRQGMAIDSRLNVPSVMLPR